MEKSENGTGSFASTGVLFGVVSPHLHLARVQERGCSHSCAPPPERMCFCTSPTPADTAQPYTPGNYHIYSKIAQKKAHGGIATHLTPCTAPIFTELNVL